jgi:quinol monooxygenase YgiN
VYLIVWEYEVRPDRMAAFEALYGATGGWSRLFGRAEGYHGTELFRDHARPTHFLTIDRWISASAHEAHLATVGEEYARLDEEGASLTLDERRIGAFES